MFSGSHADLEDTAEQLYSSPPRPQPLCFETLSLKTPQSVPSTPGTALQKIESKLEKSPMNILTSNLNNKWGCFRLLCMRPCSLSEMNLKLWKSPQKQWWIRSPLQIRSLEQSNKIMTNNPKLNTQQPNVQASEHTDEPLETDFCEVLFLHSSDRVFSPSMDQICTDQITLPNSPNNRNRCFR